jgi:crotonobetaine/carnitine-CoA ligase
MIINRDRYFVTSTIDDTEAVEMDFDFLSGAPALLQNVFAERASSEPNKPWCTMDGRTHTYGEMNASVNRLGWALVDELKIAKGDIVAVYMESRVEYLVSMFAIQRIGAVYLPCSTLFTEDELAYQFGHAEVKAVISDLSHLDMAIKCLPRDSARPIPLIVCDEDAPAGVISLGQLVASRSALMPDQAATVRIEDLAMLMYTSGTTDRPKGVMLSHANLTTEATTQWKQFRWTEDDRFLHYFPLYHAMGGIAGLAPAILAGSSLVMVPKFSASMFGKMLVENNATFASINSTHASAILRNPVTEFDGAHAARRMMLGTAVGENEWLAFEKRFNTRLMGMFGLTETLGTNVAGAPFGPRRVGSAGRIVPGYTLRLVDDEGEVVGVNEPGEALFQTQFRHGLAMGYYKDPVKTSEAFGEWMHTGDVLRVDEDGFVWFVGRKKDMIKRSGFNVAAAEVERVIREVPGVVDVAVVGTPDAVREEAIVAFVVVESPDAVQPDEIFDKCEEFLADYKRPQFIEFIEALPISFIGKVERRSLREVALKYRIDSMEWKPIDYRG